MFLLSIDFHLASKKGKIFLSIVFVIDVPRGKMTALFVSSHGLNVGFTKTFDIFCLLDGSIKTSV